MKRKLQAATSRRRSATSAAGKRKELSNHRRGMGKESQSNTESKSPAGIEIAVEHRNEITGRARDS